MDDSRSAVSPAPASSRPKREVHLQIPADMALYAAFLGKTPQIDPTLADPMIAASEARRENPWSPAALSAYVREICREKALKINKPEVTAWIRRQSLIARKRFHETQARVEATRHERAA